MEVNEMAAEECRAVLEHASLGRLGCSYENQPYVVPIHFACDSGSLYVFSTFGQKVKWMRANPKVCVQTDQAQNQSEWISAGRNIQPSVNMRVHCLQNTVIGGLMHSVSGK